MSLSSSVDPSSPLGAPFVPPSGTVMACIDPSPCAEAVLVPGNPDDALSRYQAEHGIDLLIMGAFGHSRIRHLILGSTTTAMLRRCTVSVMVLR
jgi:nucleotide-binding universal stress UspA family protein